MSQRSSLAMSRASSDFTDEGRPYLGSNPRSIAYLVYADRGDPHSAGFKTPTTRDIPQIKLPRVDATSTVDVQEYIKSVRKSGHAYESQRSHVDTRPHKPESLDAVPAEFFNQNFQLNNPRTFDAVIGENDSVVTQEKLSWYVDQVETQLAHEIADASTQFFEATAQFTAIEDQAKVTSKSVADFADVVKAQSKVVEHYEETMALQRKLVDAKNLVESLEFMREIESATEKLEKLESLADKIAQLQGLQSRLQQGVNLSKVIAAQPLLERIEVSENELKTKIRTQYAGAMLSGLRAKNDGDKNSGLGRAKEVLEYANLLDCRSQALNQYRLEVDREVKHIIRKNLPEGSDDVESQHLARSLHALSPEDAETMCQNLFNELTNILATVQNQQVPDIGPQLIEDLVTNIDSRLARVLRVRKDPASLLTPPQFVRFFMQVTEFCDFVQSLGEARATELSEFLVAQTKLYVHSWHDSLDTALQQVMVADDWKRAEVSKSTQLQANWISQSSLQDPPLLMAPADKNGNSRLNIESQTFLLSKSAIILISDLASFLILICYLPPAQSVLAARASVELLQAFNHKTYTQVIGHGAIKTAGLRHINIRNLLLAHECLRMLEMIMVPLRKCIERHNGLVFLEDHAVGSVAIEVLRSFDSVQQKYFDHRAEINQRLVKLLGDKAITAAKHIAETDWSHPHTAASNNPNGDQGDPKSHVSIYMVDLMRQTGLVARVAQDMIPANLAEDIIGKTYAIYKAKLLEAFASLEIHTKEQKRNVLRDVDYFRTKSMSLKGAGNTGDVLYETVNNFVAPDLETQPWSKLPQYADQSFDATVDQSIDQTVYTEQPDSEASSVLRGLNETRENSPTLRQSENSTEDVEITPEQSSTGTDKNSLKMDGTVAKSSEDKYANGELTTEKLIPGESSAKKADLEKDALEKSEGDKTAAEKGAVDKVEAEKAEAEKAEAEKAAAEKAKAEKAEADKVAAEKAEAEKAAAEKAAAEKAAAEKAAAEKAAAEKAAAEKAAAKKAAAEKAEAEKGSSEKAEGEKLENASAEKLITAIEKDGLDSKNVVEEAPLKAEVENTPNKTTGLSKSQKKRLKKKNKSK